LFHINSESSVAAGVRRIEAVTGANVLSVIENYINLATDTADALKASNINDIAKRAAIVMAELKDTQKTLEKTQAQIANAKLGSLLDGATEVKGLRVIAKDLKNTTADELRKMCDIVKAENPDTVTVFAGVNGEKLTFCASCGKDALAKGVHAGNLVREIAKLTGGNGGGKPDSAMAGGKDISKLSDALSSVVSLVEAQIK
jgi:alanyl-tRNA synthetase